MNYLEERANPKKKSKYINVCKSDIRIFRDSFHTENTSLRPLYLPVRPSAYRLHNYLENKSTDFDKTHRFWEGIQMGTVSSYVVKIGKEGRMGKNGNGMVILGYFRVFY